MQIRSSSRLVSNPSSNPTSSTNSNLKGRNRRRSKQRIKEFNLDELSPPIVMMADQLTMAQLLQAPTEGYEDAIFVPTITADNFELKHGLLTLVQNKHFFGHDKEDPHAHIRYFNKITTTLKFPNVLNTSIKLMLFPFSLEGATRIWLEKEPPRLIFTWDDLVSKFINQFFPPSKTINLRNEITNFQQRFDEYFSEAWDRFKYLLRIWNPRAIISDRGTYFCNDQFAKVMLKFGVTHSLATLYHPQTSGQVEVTNRGLKRILERIIGENRASWSDKLDDALGAFRTDYKTPIGCTPYKLVYGKACHLPIELEHKANWA
nr:reverse transcriptase domain-containing protein [Tanacetum cinerariifolium]